MRLSSKPDIKRLKARGDLEGLIRALGYAADRTVRADATQALVETGSPAIRPLIDALEDASVRDAAADTLAAIGVLAVEPLIAVLGHRNSGVRMASAKALAAIGMLAVEPLVVALRSKNSVVRMSVIGALAQIGTLVLEPLIKTLGAENEQGYVRVAVAEALGQLGDTRAINPLTVALRSDRDAEVRAAAAKALERLGWQPDWSKPKEEPAKRPAEKPVAPPEDEDKKLFMGSSLVGSAYQWNRIQKALPELKPTSKDMIRRLQSEISVSRTFDQPAQLVRDIQIEFRNYSRLKDIRYGDSFINVIFDNYVSSGATVIPATKQLEIRVLTDGSHYYVFYTATFPEHYW